MGGVEASSTYSLPWPYVEVSNVSQTGRLNPGKRAPLNVRGLNGLPNRSWALCWRETYVALSETAPRNARMCEPSSVISEFWTSGVNFTHILISLQGHFEVGASYDANNSWSACNALIIPSYVMRCGINSFCQVTVVHFVVNWGHTLVKLLSLFYPTCMHRVLPGSSFHCNYTA